MTAASGRVARARRWWWLAPRMGVAALLLGWFAWYAYLRLTVEPPLSAQAAFANATDPGPPKPNDVTAELTKVILPLDRLIPLTLPPPPDGMAWKWDRGDPLTCLDVADAVRGDWTPAERPQLRAVIAHLQDKLTRLRIVNLHVLCGRPWQLDSFASFDPAYNGIGSSELRHGIRLLVTDARYQHAQRGDLAAAWQDLQTAIWLTQPETLEIAFTVITRHGYLHLILSELRQMSREHVLDEALVAEIDAVLRRWPPPDETWRTMLAGEESLVQRTIDACFTRDERGNGWYVVSRQQNALLALAARPGPASAFAQHPTWNLASCLYNDRRTVEAKRVEYFDALRHLPDLTYAEARAEIERLGERAPPFCPVDGAILAAGDLRSLLDYYEHPFAMHAELRATRLTLALSRVRGERGAYPETLAELVPAYIPDLPLDPFGDAPFLYRRDGDGYVLYSRGPNGVDDGGATIRPGGFSWKDPDHVYSLGRPEPAFEPELVPIEDGTPGKP